MSTLRNFRRANNTWSRGLYAVSVCLVLLSLSCTGASGASDPEAEATGSVAEAEATGSVAIEAFVIESSDSFFNLSAATVAAAARGDVSGVFPAGGSGGLRARLEAAAAAGRIEIAEAPVLTTVLGGGVSIQTGIQVPVQTISNDAITVQFVNATLRLVVGVEAHQDDRLLLQVELQKRYPLRTDSEPAVPIQTTEVNTEAVIHDGGTVVIGGVYEHEPGATSRGNELLLFLTAQRVD